MTDMDPRSTRQARWSRRAGVPTTAPRDRRYQRRPATHFGSYLPVRTDCIFLQGIEVLLQAADVLLHVRNGGAETTHSVSVGPTLAPSTENQTSSELARDSSPSSASRKRETHHDEAALHKDVGEAWYEEGALVTGWKQAFVPRRQR